MAGLAYPVLMWVIAIGVAWFAVDHLVLRQISLLRRTANAYAKGHFEARTPAIDHAPEEQREPGTPLHTQAHLISTPEHQLLHSLKEQQNPQKGTTPHTHTKKSDNTQP